MKSFIEFYLENTNSYKFPITTTAEKSRVIANENNFINENITTRSPDEQVVGVVGRAEGLDRHIKQFVNLGFNKNNILLFELDERMANDLKLAAVGKLPQYVRDEYGNLQVATDENGNEKVRVIQWSILKPISPFVKTDQPWFDPDKVTHVDLDFTTAATPIEIKTNITSAFNAYNNVKSLVCVHSLRGSNTRTDVTNKTLNGPLKKLQDFFAKGVSVTRTGKPKDRVTEFRNIYDYYINRNNDNSSGKQQFLKDLQQLCNGSVYAQSYTGANGTPMASFTIIKNSTEKIIKADESIYKKDNITDTDKTHFPGMYKSFKAFYNNSKTPEGFNVNNQQLKQRGVEQYTHSDYNDYMELLDNMYTWFRQETSPVKN